MITVSGTGRIRSELVLMKWARILCTIAVSLNGLALLVNAFTARLSAHTVAACALTVLLGGLLIFFIGLGSPRLLRLLENGQLVPDSGYLIALLDAMRYPMTRRIAVERLAAVSPSLSRESISGVDKGLWKRVYLFAQRAPLPYVQVAFHIAILTRDAASLPYLERLVGRPDLPADLHEDLVQRLRMLMEAISQGSQAVEGP